MAKFNLRSKRTWKKILSIGLGILLTVGAVFGISALISKSEETTKEINPKYAIGGLTEDGKYLETEESIYTEDAFECQGLDIELDFKSNISYRVFFYGNENDFISSTELLTSNYDETATPFLAKYARIVITPNEDEEIKWYEKNGYAKQLTIEVNKEQVSFLDKIADCENQAKILGQGSWSTSGDGFTATSSPFYFFDKVDVSNADALVMKVKTETLNAVLSYADTTFKVPMMYDGTTDKVISDYNYSLVGVADGFTYISYDVSNYTSIFGCVDVQSVDFVEIYVV